MKAKIEIVVDCPRDMVGVLLEDCESCEHHEGRDLVEVSCGYGEVAE